MHFIYRLVQKRFFGSIFNKHIALIFAYKGTNNNAFYFKIGVGTVTAAVTFIKCYSLSLFLFLEMDIMMSKFRYYKI